MKKRYYLLFLFIILLRGCVHDYPTMTDDGEEGVDPTLVQVNTEVTLDLELVSPIKPARELRKLLPMPTAAASLSTPTTMAKSPSGK